MTEIQNSKPPYHLKKREFQYMFGSLKLGTRPQGGESGGPILEFEIYL
jgi:hypothetical protein